MPQGMKQGGWLLNVSIFESIDTQNATGKVIWMKS